jgi:hypothetical protein
MLWILLLLTLIALVNAGLLVWIGVSIHNNQKETLKNMNEQETRLNQALGVLQTAVAALLVMVQNLVAANPDLSDETAAIENLATSINDAIATAQGGGTPEPIPVDPEPVPGGGDPTGGGTSGGDGGEPTGGGEPEPGGGESPSGGDPIPGQES